MGRSIFILLTLVFGLALGPVSQQAEAATAIENQPNQISKSLAQSLRENYISPIIVESEHAFELLSNPKNYVDLDGINRPRAKLLIRSTDKIIQEYRAIESQLLEVESGLATYKIPDIMSDLSSGKGQTQAMESQLLNYTILQPALTLEVIATVVSVGEKLEEAWSNLEDCLTGSGADCSDDTEPPPAEICDNGVDDDGDGAADCQDSDCLTNPVCISEPI